MRSIIPVTLVLVGLAACGSTNRYASADKAPSTRPATAPDLQLADDLVRYARGQRSLEAYVVALELMSRLPLRERPLVKEPLVGEAPGPGGAGTTEAAPPKATTPPPTFAQVRAEALALAGADVAQRARIERIAEPAHVRGSTEGDGYHHDRIEARDTDIYRMDFRGDRSARVRVSGDGDTDLDLYVFDENDNLICSDEDSSDYCVCEWSPRWTGTFRIVIKNLGHVYNRYRLSWN